MVTVRLWTPYHCANPSQLQALQIVLLWWLSPRSAPHTTTLWERKSTYGKKADMVFVCEHITFIIWCPLHQSRSSGPHSMIKSSNWWPTTFHWNGPPPDMIKPGRTQLSNGLKRRCSQILIWWERQNHLIRLENMKPNTRVDFNIYTTDLNPKQFYTYVKW